jgi:hypothetical protein
LRPISETQALKNVRKGSGDRLLCDNTRSSFNLALERVPLGGGQWSAAKLSEEMRTLQYGEEVNLQVNPLALHQGLHIFKKFIRLLGHDLIQMGGKKGIPMIASFMGLAEVFNGLNIKFFVSPRREMEVENVNLLVQQMACKLVKRHCGRELQKM